MKKACIEMLEKDAASVSSPAARTKISKEIEVLRKQHRQPKTTAEKAQLGWMTIREVRLDIYRQALAEAKSNLVDGIKELQHKSEVRAARVFMDAFSKAVDEGKNAHSAGNIAMTRAGFNKLKK